MLVVKWTPSIQSLFEMRGDKKAEPNAHCAIRHIEWTRSSSDRLIGDAQNKLRVRQIQVSIALWTEVLKSFTAYLGAVSLIRGSRF